MKSRATVITIASMLAAVVLALWATTPARAVAPIVNNQTLSIAENSPNTTATTPNKIAAFDPENGPMTYDVIDGTGKSVFAVDLTTGIVTVADELQLDYESGTHSYTLNIRVQDSEDPALTDDAIITINVLDQSDQTPDIVNQSFDVDENSPTGTPVGTIDVDDDDTNDFHTFTVTGGDGLGLFNIANGSGNITVAPGATLNHELDDSYALNVDVEDEGGQTDSAVMTIAVNDLNENPILNDQSFNLSEAADKDDLVGTIVATDPEGQALLFSLSGTSAFAINQDGQLIVADSSQLDYEGSPSHSITFAAQVMDPGGKSDTGAITVNLTNVNDPPTTSGITPDPLIVNEGSAPREINLWSFFDDDEDADADLSFFPQGNSNDSLVTSVVINNVTGKATLTFAATGGGEANITIRAFDTDGAHVDDTFKVDVNDGPTSPPIEQVSANEDDPNLAIDLYDIFDDAESPDVDLTYTIVGAPTFPGLFAVAPVVNEPNLILDFATNVHGKSDVVVRATDGGGLFSQTTIKVTVNAVNDAPTTTGIDDVNVNEDAPNVVIDLFDAFADIEDDDNELDYSYTGNTSLFTSVNLDENAGTLTLDFKENTSGTTTLTVTAEDKGGLDVETSFDVVVGADNDAPVLTDFSDTTDEDTELKFTTNDFASKYEDADNDPMATVRIENLPADGTLKLNGADVVVAQVIPAAELGNLSFFPALNWNEGSTTFDWNASDGSSYAAQPATVTITVNSKNDLPKIESFEKTGEESVNVLFTAQDFIGNFSDVDGDSLVKVQITSLPQHGQLKRGNINVELNEQLDMTGLGQLRFVPEADWSGTTSFNWKAYDGNPQNTYSAAATVTLKLNPINDPPAIDLNGGSAGTDFNAVFVAGGPAMAIAGNDLQITDIDSTTMDAATVIIINRKNGNKEVLTADPTGTNIDVSFSAAAGALFLTGTDTIDNYEKVLRTVAYRIEPEVANPDATTRNISFRVNDGGANSNDAVSHVEIIHPRIEITVEPEFQTVIKGTTAVFTIVIKNTGDVDLNNVIVTSAAVPDCNRSFPKLEAGKSLPAFACIASNVTQRIDNELIVTATDAQVGTQVTDDVESVVRVLQDIIINIATDPLVGDTIVKGQNAVFTVTVINPSESKLKDVQVHATVDYDLIVQNALPAAAVPAPACDFVIGDLNAKAEKEYSCTIANVQASFAIEVVATGMIEGVAPTEDFDIADIGVLDMTMEAFSDPFQILAGQPTTVEFNLTLTNVSNVPLTLSALTSAAHGNLLNAANGQVSANTCPAMNLALQPAEVRSCSYEVTLILQPPAFTNSITAVAGDGAGHELTIVDEAIVSVANFSPLEVLLSADPPSLVAPGGAANLSVQVSNNTSSEVTLDALNDTVLGTLDGKGTCELPTVIPGNGSYSCTYSVTISGKVAGDVVTYTVTAIADSEDVSDSVAIAITAFPQVRVLLPTLSKLSAAGEPNNGVCDAMAITANRGYYFLPDDANDWYRFTLESPANLKVKLSNYMADGQIVLFTGNCTSPTILRNNGNYESVKEIDMGPQEEGTYFIWVLTDHGFTSASAYTLMVETSAP